jgi:tetratricopeptide (TPR) repeat protein
MGKGSDDAVILFQIALFEAGLNQYDKALTNINSAYEKNPKYKWMLELKALISRRNNDIEEAGKICKENIADNNECVWAYRQLAVINLLKGENTFALENANKAYDLNKDFPYTGETLVIAYHFNGKTAERDKLLSELTINEQPDEPKLQDLISGKITLKQYYI